MVIDDFRLLAFDYQLFARYLLLQKETG